MASIKRNALGRGLDSLIPMDDVPARGSSAINDIDLQYISPNPDQPRTSFDEEALDELAASIRELGIIQPLSLRKTGDNAYQIIAGERRYRAALRVIDAVGGLESMSMIDHTLLLEYRLGYIGSYEQVEREQERKKKTA